MKVRRFLHRALGSVGRALNGFSPAQSPNDVEKAEQRFYIRYLQPGMTAFDVGANIGELSLLFSRFVGEGGQVHAFEASLETYQRLHTVLTAADRKNVHVNHLALSDSVTIARLNVYDTDHSGWTTFADRPLASRGVAVRPVRVEDVPTTTIDEYCERRQISRIDLLKIDVEGAEYQVLLGAERMMRERQIACIVFEFGQTTFDMGNDPVELRRLIEARGYRLRNVIKRAPVFPGGRSVSTAQFSMCVSTPY